MSVRTFLLPDLGEGLTEAELVNWLVAVGDTVVVDQPVAEVETAKSLVEVPSPFAGRVAQLHGQAGESVDVGRPLISVDTAAAATAGAGLAAGMTATGTGETMAPAAAVGPAEAAEAVAAAESAGETAAGDAYREEEKAGSGNVLIGYGTPANGQSPRRTRAPRLRIGAAGGQVAVPAAAQAAGQVAGPTARTEAPRCVSPLVRRLARDAGLKLEDVAGSGPDGLILRRDVEAAVAPARAEDTAGEGAARGSAGGTGAGAGREVHSVRNAGATAGDSGTATDARTGLAVTSRTPVRGLRRTVAANLSRSRSLIPEATVWVDVDATALMDLRADLSRQREDAPSLLAFLARFTLAGLTRFPELNTRFVPAEERVGAGPGEDPRDNAGEDQDEQQAVIEAFDGVNLGIAVQAERGLMVPSVRRADTLSTRELNAEIRRLTSAAQAGRATPAELSSGTFTLNNYGVYGVDGSAAIINYPESAILGVGRIIEKPWVVSGQLAVRKVTQLTLVFDHRVCDGATAGGFLRYVADAVENPGRVLADL
ncbi:dihydrolipoamide acetyltransferase family protein [Arthrobacter sp. zg-Y1110]|uniref:dihydrolipoamide acetyltransferase family protein n=1 Tax=Arthrobacter sp. zg-Y1110 TaxID=2886932 RepID=UPI001D14A6E9|nr:dihydrolipoamide acetyltransferase family protein [Arthrobacter sp. zg-Y1110]MCC3290143.1 2-oxo acid dehydrogenase subunit E2 [Arthrobacter sp. zg-Y1110]UWX84467.1 2-oxo acid dehydrogenase subunit E2 [Arthrobacter sp. zg-Y1110]